MASIFLESDKKVNNSSEFWQRIYNPSDVADDIENCTIFEGPLKLRNSNLDWQESFFYLTSTSLI